VNRAAWYLIAMLAALAAAVLVADRNARADLPAWVLARPAVLGESPPRVLVLDGHALLCWSEDDPRDGTRWWALVKVPLVGELPEPVTTTDARSCAEGW